MKCTNNEKIWINGRILGFVDGEGCYHVGITRNKTMKLGYQVIPEFTIVQHVKDVDLLHAIKHYYKCGIVQSNRGKNDNSKAAPRWCYRVRAIADLDEIIVPFFTKNRLLTAKDQDFNAFKLVVSMMKTHQHLTLEGLNKIREIKGRMNRGSKFSSPD